jgi:quinol monooxygenase YgiN
MFEVTARMRIREGELDGFEQRAAEIMRLTREKDTQTLRYDWFVSDDGTACEVREGYLEPDGLLEHNTHVRDARDKLFRDHAYGHDMTIYGEPSPALAELIERMAGHVVFTRLSFLQGLDGDQPGALAVRATDGRAPTFEATARLRVREGELEAFKQQAAEVMRLVRAQDDPPLRYDWFLSDDDTECEVREAYVNADALHEHQQRIAEAKTKLFRELVEGHTMTFYDELSPALAGALQAMGTPYRRFSFMQGLGSAVDALDEVPA